MGLFGECPGERGENNRRGKLPCVRVRSLHAHGVQKMKGGGTPVGAHSPARGNPRHVGCHLWWRQLPASGQ